MKKGDFLLIMVFVFLFGERQGFSQERMLDSGWHHLRNADPREWSEFPEVAGIRNFMLRFAAQPNTFEQALSLRQYDIKLNWRILLNGKALGSLVGDEKDLMGYFKIPPGSLKAENILEISCSDTQPDDIRVGEIVLHQQPLYKVLSEAQVAIEVFDAESKADLPARITIVNARGILQTVSGSTHHPLAVRPGHVYTGNGKALLSLPAGSYTLYAGRGFEYGIDSVQLVLAPGDFRNERFFIKREVSTPGWVGSDTHIHTFTWSRHGDATAAERALTIAGEGIELPVMTDHNVHVDLKPFAIDQNVAGYFTTVTGNEVTTPVGHFNVFPVTPGQAVINHRADNWETLARNINATGGTKGIILNHARDIHLNFRPHDSARYLSSAGMRLDDWDLFANAMEIINSGSQQTDQKELMRDWFAMLNHGNIITPAGSSDSHDVSRYFVGQARTYIRCDDDDPGNIDVKEAVENFLAGNVMVSFGLLTEIEVNDAYGPGELVPASDAIKVSVTVSGPAWTRAEKVVLYANGMRIGEEKIQNQDAAGIKWRGVWNLTAPTHDIYLVAVAEGPAGAKPYWPVAKPYQPATPAWQAGLLGLSGAVWFDADKNGKRNSARDYAHQLNRQTGNDFKQLIERLSAFDESVSIQSAALLYKSGNTLTEPELIRALRSAAPATRSGFQTVIAELEALKK